MTWYPAEDWRVRRTFNPITRNDEVLICQLRPSASDPVPVIVEISTGQALLRDVDPLVTPAEPIELRFPEGVLEAIAELVKPGPSQGEVRRLEEALAIERERVDKTLEAAHALPYADDAGDPGSTMAAAARSAPVTEIGDGSSVYVWREAWDATNKAAVHQSARAADLRTGLDLALEHAQAIYDTRKDISTHDLGHALSVLVETLKGTIDRDDRLPR